MYILGISAYYHDSAACLVRDGVIVAAAQEERFTRKKADRDFPAHSIQFCLKQGEIALSSIDALVFYDKPLLKFDRLLETYLAFAPRGFRSFATAMHLWLSEKLFLREKLKVQFAQLAGVKQKHLPKLDFTEHHQAHAASAFFPSPFADAAVLCMDGVGEWATTSAWQGQGNSLKPLWEIQFPHSLGLLYSAFTYYTGFKVNSGEYKVMGLAPYGRPLFEKIIREQLIDIKADGSFRLNLEFFDFCTGLEMTGPKFHRLCGGPPRDPESPITQREMDLAASIQKVCEDVVLTLAQTLHTQTGARHLCLAGGVALNCVANGRLLREGPFDDLWIQPAAGDAGGALGAALSLWYQGQRNPRQIDSRTDSMQGGLLGPQFTNGEIADALTTLGASFRSFDDEELYSRTAKLLATENVVGWFQGRMEFGPRALGSRSILGDARSSKMQSTMNLKIKYRESFRPFAPAVLREDCKEYFELASESAYMLVAAPVRRDRRISPSAQEAELFGIEKLKIPRSDLPAVTHVDYSARVQTVSEERNLPFTRLLREFRRQTGCSVLVNTSFNVRGEPIVCSVNDAYRCFMRTEMDALVVGNFILLKTEQPVFKDTGNWRNEFELD